MSEEVLVNVTLMETRVAVVDNGAIQDIHIERAASRGIVGNIYVGKVVRVLPGMQAALQAVLAKEQMEDAGGFILRTAAEGVGEDELRAVRELARSSVERILVDSRESFVALQDFCREYMPEVSGLLEHYQGERPLFDLHGIEDEIVKAPGRKVELNSGGSLVIDQTEAMTTIDVNTGSFVGRRNLEETIFKTNLEAATTLARQLRLRKLGGIIIVDFIDMQDQEHQRQVHRTLEKAMHRDPVRNKITGVSELGPVEMTRKRTRESLEHILCEDCPVCEGRGVLKTAESVCYEIFREITRDARAYENDTLMVLAAQAVVDRLLDEESTNVADLEEFVGKTISFRVEPTYSQEHFDIVLL